jgi:hypothetical protein
MSFMNEDPLSGLERGLRASRPQLGSDAADRIAGSASRSRSRGARVLMATAVTTGAFSAMAMFGGMSYAVASVHHVVGGGTSTPADSEYVCDINTSEPDHNGDYHSNCHTGSKGRGAGGNDKPGK